MIVQGKALPIGGLVGMTNRLISLVVLSKHDDMITCVSCMNGKLHAALENEYDGIST